MLPRSNYSLYDIIKASNSHYGINPQIDYLSDHNSGIPDIKDMDLDEVMRTSYSFGAVTTPNTIRALYKNRHRTCGNCKYDTVSEKDTPCVNCIHSMDMRKDLWIPKGE